MKDYSEVFFNLIIKLLKTPGVRVNREEFLRKHFGNLNELIIDKIVLDGPDSVFSFEELKLEAYSVVKDLTKKSSAASFISGLPSNPFTMVISGGIDISQFFGFTLNMAQKIAYLFGEDDLFNGNSSRLTSESKTRITAYLGTMFGISGSNLLLVEVTKKTSTKVVDKTISKLFLSKIAVSISEKLGVKITTKTVEKTITKAIPIVGGAISSGITYVTFKPMGNKLVNELYISKVGLS